MNSAYTDIHKILDPGTPELRHKELMHVLSLSDEKTDFSFLDQVKNDVFRLFAGEYPGYKACNTKYHDLDHTTSVALAMGRLIHGASISGTPLSPEIIITGVVAAYFHDVGLIQSDDETEGTGARHIIGHELRSIRFMSEYLKGKAYPSDAITDCEKMITCTILDLNPSDISFASDEVRTAGFMLGSADLLAQLAERTYLEKLRLLYKEFEEARLPGFSSELDLLKMTEKFYSNVAEKRIKKQLGDMSRYMQPHFLARHDMDSDLYCVSIRKNINYISKLVTRCSDRMECFLDNLKRSI